MNQFIDTALKKAVESADMRSTHFNPILTCEDYLVDIPVKVIE